MELQLKGKKFLVTAASKGLGKACALELAREGAHVIISSRDEARLKDTAQEIMDQTGSKVSYLKMDVSKASEIQSVLEQISKDYDSLDGLICNAGGPPAGAFLSFSDEDWMSAFETNLLSIIRIIRQAVPLMEKAGGGRVVTIASSSVKVPIPGLVLSNTMRTGIQGLMKTLSSELADKQILLNTVCPGRVATDRLQELDSMKAEREGKSVEQIKQENIQDIPLGRYGTPQEFAQLVTFLLAPSNTYLTGSTYFVDGGMVKSL